MLISRLSKLVVTACFWVCCVAPTLGAEPLLSMPRVAGRRGLEVTTSVEVTDAAGAEFTAAEFMLSYDPAHVTPVGVEQAGTLSEGWLAASKDFGGRYKVALASADPVAGTGSLIRIRMLVGLNAPSTITLTISNAFLNADPATSVRDGIILVRDAPSGNEPPVAAAGADVTVQVTEPFTLSAAGSGDTDGTVVAYEWELTDGATFTGPAVLHVFDWVGVYHATLRVGDNVGAVTTDTVTITVTPTEPVAANPAGGPTIILAGGGVMAAIPESVFRGGLLAMQADRVPVDAVRASSAPDGFSVPRSSLLRELTLTRDGAPVTTLREEVEVTLDYDGADLVLDDGSILEPAHLTPFVVRRDGRIGILRVVRRSAGSITFATPSIGIVGLGVAPPGTPLPAPETVAAPEDTNGDGLINIIDLVTVARAFGQTGAAAALGDVNGDGRVNIIDLVTVSSLFGQPAGAPAANPHSAGSGVVTLSIQQVDGTPYGSVFDVVADTLVGVAGYEFTVVVDANAAVVERGEAFGSRAFWLDPVARGDGILVGSVRLGPAHHDGAETLARLFVQRRAGDRPPTVALRRVLLADGVGRRMRHRVSADPAMEATQATVYTNYPNPFNPETWIPFSLGVDAHVTVHIYNARGQVVRTIDLGRRDAGEHTSPSHAAHWDGRNDHGEAMGSGVYYYQVAAGATQTTRRMLMVK